MSVQCTNCGATLPDDYAGPIETRPPCPTCGSMARTVGIAGHVEIKLTGSAMLTALGSVSEALPDLPSLSLQAIIIPGAKTSEGQLIEAVAPPWFEIIAMLARDPRSAQSITPRQWEEIIAGAYSKAGFEEVTLTPRSGDYGRDVIAVKRAGGWVGTVRVIDQVKAYRPGRLVTADDARALLGVVEADKASKGLLTTTSDFAPRLRDDKLLKPYMPARIELVDGKTLVARLVELAKAKP